MNERTMMGVDLDLLRLGLDQLSDWEARWPAVAPDSSTIIAESTARDIITELTGRLTENYPFFHPAYAGQMLKPPHMIAATAYFLAQQINPNNHALDGGPATAALERESIAQLAAMIGYNPETSLTHLTSSGTIANLEALWVARELQPESAIAFSADAHYTHSRMCDLLGVRGITITVDEAGRLDLNDLRQKLQSEQIGTVVATAGTTSLGNVDPIRGLLELAGEHHFRIHVDAAYGGFFRLLADLPPDHPAALAVATGADFRAISECDSVVIDPHKHGLQPYGCGSVLFRDASVGRFYKHNSPYTYFTSAALHLGEISLECSRAGASAAALWATLKAFPLTADLGLGTILARCREAAVLWGRLLESSTEFSLVMPPSLDILAYYPNTPAMTASSISQLSHRIFEAGMKGGADAYFVAKVNLTPDRLPHHPRIVWDQPQIVALRSVLMKPEHLEAVPGIHERMTDMFHRLTQE